MYDGSKIAACYFVKQLSLGDAKELAKNWRKGISE